MGAGKGGGGYGARAIRLYFSVSLFLFLSLPHYLSISVFSQVFFFQFSYHLLNSPNIAISLSVSHTLHDMWWRGSPVKIIWVLKHLSLLHSVVSPSLRSKVTATADFIAVLPRNIFTSRRGHWLCRGAVSVLIVDHSKSTEKFTWWYSGCLLQKGIQGFMFKMEE